jgi:tight adherence protein B
MVSSEMPEPIATEFRKTYEEQNLGLSIKLALENLAERVPLLDLRMTITAVLIQRETGGNLAEILEKVSYTIRERFRNPRRSEDANYELAHVCLDPVWLADLYRRRSHST